MRAFLKSDDREGWGGGGHLETNTPSSFLHSPAFLRDRPSVTRLRAPVDGPDLRSGGGLEAFSEAGVGEVMETLAEILRSLNSLYSPTQRYQSSSTISPRSIVTVHRTLINFDIT